MLFGHLYCLFGLFKVGSRHHELEASYVDGPLQHTFEVVFVGLFPMVDTTENRVTKIDTYLEVGVNAEPEIVSKVFC